MQMQRREKMFQVNHVVARVRDGALNRVVQFGKVAWPRQGRQERERRLRERPRTKPLLRADMFDQTHGENRHILRAIAQRRHVDADRAQAPMEIGAEPVRVHVGIDSRCRARNDRASRSRRACDRSDFAVARDAREARLNRGGQLGDILQKQRASACGGDLAVARHRFQIRRRIGDGAPNSSRSTRPGSPSPHSTMTNAAVGMPASRVQIAHDRIDRRSALGGDQYAAVQVRGAADEFPNPRDRGRFSQQLQRARRRPLVSSGRAPASFMVSGMADDPS